MALFTENELRERYRRESLRRPSMGSSREILNEGRDQVPNDKIKIFLSHSSQDMEVIAGLKLTLEDIGYYVYVDWNDPALDPNNVTPRTAEILRERMKACDCLLYAFSENAKNSRWMPWELGYFDGLRNSRVAVLPISTSNNSNVSGDEFVGLYYFIQIHNTIGTNEKDFWVYNGTDNVYFKSWIKGKGPSSLH